MILSAVLLWAFPARSDVPDCRVPGLGCVELTSARIASPRPWRVEIDLSEFGETHDVFLSTRSRETLRCGSGHATLFLRCLDDRTSLFVWHGCEPHGAEPLVNVELSIDGGDVDAQDWQIGGDPATLGLWIYSDARQLVEQLYGAEYLALRFEDPLGLKREMSFPVAGLESASVPLRVACGWSEDWVPTG